MSQKHWVGCTSKLQCLQLTPDENQCLQLLPTVRLNIKPLSLSNVEDATHQKHDVNTGACEVQGMRRATASEVATNPLLESRRQLLPVEVFLVRLQQALQF